MLAATSLPVRIYCGLEPDDAMSCATAALNSPETGNDIDMCPRACPSRKLTEDVLGPDFGNEGGVHGVAQSAPLAGPG